MADYGNGLRLALVGCSGNVGSQLLELLDERAVPYRELRLFRLEPEASEEIEVGERHHPVRKFAGPDDLAGADVAFIAAPGEVAEAIGSAKAAPVLIDLSGHNRPPGAAPMVAPGFTPREAVRKLAAAGPLHVPHPVALALATIAQAIGDVSALNATVLLSASALGREAIRHQVEQSAELLNGRLDLRENERQVAFNLAPLADVQLADAIVAQAGRLLTKPVPMTLRLVQVPVLHGTAMAIAPGFAAGIDQCRERLRSAPGILLVEDEQALGVVDSIGQEALLMSAHAGGAGPMLWCVFDNARHAALTALWIAECLLPASDNLN